MKNRKDLEKRTAAWYEAQGYIVQRAYMKAVHTERGWIATSNDFFGCMDGIAVYPDGGVVFYQCTSTDYDGYSVDRADPTATVRKHRRTIDERMPVGGVTVHLHVWRKKQGRWEHSIYRRDSHGWHDLQVPLQKTLYVFRKAVKI